MNLIDLYMHNQYKVVAYNSMVNKYHMVAGLDFVREQPPNPSIGMTYYDTKTNNLLIFNGDVWNVVSGGQR